VRDFSPQYRKNVTVAIRHSGQRTVSEPKASFKLKLFKMSRAVVTRGASVSVR
jgi:hypothetical protein